MFRVGDVVETWDRTVLVVGIVEGVWPTYANNIDDISEVYVRSGNEWEYLLVSRVDFVTMELI